MICQSESIGDVLKISVNGGLTTATAEKFRKTIQEGLKTHKNILLDCKSLTQIDTVGMETLAASLKETIEHDGALKLAAIPPSPWIVFDITKSASVFDIYGTVEEALAAFKGAS